MFVFAEFAPSAAATPAVTPAVTHATPTATRRHSQNHLFTISLITNSPCHTRIRNSYNNYIIIDPFSASRRRQKVKNEKVKSEKETRVLNPAISVQ